MTTEFWLVWDLDGTLVDNRHRVHHIKGKDRSDADWKTYVSEAHRDTVYDEMAWLLESFHAAGHYHHAVVTGRMEHEGENTRLWLQRQRLLHIFDEFHFRAEGDFRPAPEIKLEVIQKRFLEPTERRLVAVFEDHPGTVKALRELGVTCLHVREYM